MRFVLLLAIVAVVAAGDDDVPVVEEDDVIPSGAVVWGKGLSLAASGRPSFFTIQPTDEFGNNITKPGLGKHFVVLVEPPSMRGAVMEIGDGSLLVTLTHEWGTLVNSTVAVTIPDRSESALAAVAAEEERKREHGDDGKKKFEPPRIHVGASPYRVQITQFYQLEIEEGSDPLPSIAEREENDYADDESSPLFQEHQQLKGVKAAYATLVVSDPFVLGTVVLMHTLRKSRAMFPLIAMVTDAVSQKAKDLMVHHGIIIKEVERIGNPKGAHLEEKAWDAVYTKCRAWQLTEYEKVLFMDADQVVLKNIDHLFLKPAFSAVPDLAPPTVFNSGLMLLQPSESVFQEMMNATAAMKSYDEGDQGFLNEFFWGRWHMLPFTYNFLKSKTGNPEAYYWFLNLQRWNIHVVHIVGVKPWVCSPYRDCGTGFMERHIPELWLLWWSKMEEVCGNGHIACLDPVVYEDIEQRTIDNVLSMPFTPQDLKNQ